MTEVMTFKELSEVYRTVARNSPEPIRQDLYPAIGRMLKGSRESLDKAIKENASETILDGLRTRMTSSEGLARAVIELRVEYIFKHTLIPPYLLTPEEQQLKGTLDRIRQETKDCLLTTYVTKASE